MFLPQTLSTSSMCHSLFPHTHYFYATTPSLPLQQSSSLLLHIHSYLNLFSPLMASSTTTDLKQRIITPDQTTATTNDKNGTASHKRDKRMKMAKHGLRSLIIAVSFPLSITLLSIYISSSFTFSNHNKEVITGSKKPFWFPPSWALHLMLPASSFLMGLSAWMVWANGGFHRDLTALLLYLLQILYTVLWDPVVFGFGATSFGLVVCFGNFVTLFGCMRLFGKVNPVAATLIKPCLALIAFLFFVNLKLIFI